MIKSVTIIGSGNVATHLGKGLLAAGIKINEVFSPTANHAAALAKILKATAIENISELASGSDMFLLCIPDRFIKDVSLQIPATGGIVAHTSGITPLTHILKHKNKGVFYPLQTFSANRNVSLKNVPFCIEASSKKVYETLYDTASLLSNTVKNVDTEKRKHLHLAAVFVNNFVNFMYSTGAQILKNENIDFDFLIPLIQETAEKIADMPPAQAQTGPAIRNDIKTIEIHKTMLAKTPDIKNLYTYISNLIIKRNYE